MGPVALALVSAALSSVAARPWGLGVLAWIAIVPLVVALDRSRSAWRGAGIAWLAWIGVAVVAFEGVLPVVPWAFALIVVVAGAGWAFVGAGYVVVLRRLGERAALAFLPAGFVAVEFVASRRVIFGDLANPITALGYTQFGLPLHAAAGWSGVSGVTFALIAINIAVLLAARRRHPGLAVAFASVALAASTVPVPGQTPQPDAGPPLRVALIQDAHPSIEVLMARMHLGAAETLLERYQALERSVALDDVDLVVWGETSLPSAVRDGVLPAEAVAAMRPDAAYLVGSREQARGRWYNVSLLIRDGRIEDTYRKQALVPWIERGYDAGSAAGALRVGQHRVGTGVCLDSTFGVLARDAVVSGADVLAYLTDDTFAGRTSTAELHMRVSAFRAAETGRSVAFVNRSGPSGAFGPRGEALALLPRHQPAVDVVDVPASAGLTPYVVRGDWLGVLATAATAALFILAWRPVARGRARD